MRASGHVAARGCGPTEVSKAGVAHFRLWWLGLRCNNQTCGDSLNGDGWADEVQFRARISTVLKDGSVLATPSERTGVELGDPNQHPGRVLAGSGRVVGLSGVQIPGGLVTGDVHPPADPVPAPPSRDANLLPRAPTDVDTGNPSCGPLLLVMGGQDHTVPEAITKSTLKQYRHSPGPHRAHGVQRSRPLPDHRLQLARSRRRLARLARQAGP